MAPSKCGLFKAGLLGHCRSPCCLEVDATASPKLLKINSGKRGQIRSPFNLPKSLSLFYPVQSTLQLYSFLFFLFLSISAAADDANRGHTRRPSVLGCEHRRPHSRAAPAPARHSSGFDAEAPAASRRPSASPRQLAQLAGGAAAE